MADSGTAVKRWADREPTPWRNGGGVTRELAASPSGAHADEFAWRVSIADVDRAGPFSTFPGVDRVIILLEGTAMVLSFDLEEHVEKVLAPREPFRFSGDDMVTCSLPAGSTRDLNVMTRRGRATAEVVVHRTVDPVSLEAGPSHYFVVALEGNVPASRRSGETWTLGRYDVLEPAEAVSVGPGDFAVIEIAGS